MELRLSACRSVIKADSGAAALGAPALPGAPRAGGVELMTDCLAVVSPSRLLMYLSVVSSSLLAPLPSLPPRFPPGSHSCLRVFHGFVDSVVPPSPPPSALVLLSVPLQRSADCDDGGGGDERTLVLFTRKCQSVCLALGGHGADVISVRLCVWPVTPAAGLPLGADVWGWSVSSVPSPSQTGNGKQGPLENSGCWM